MRQSTGCISLFTDAAMGDTTAEGFGPEPAREVGANARLPDCCLPLSAAADVPESPQPSRSLSELPIASGLPVAGAAGDATSGADLEDGTGSALIMC